MSPAVSQTTYLLTLQDRRQVAKRTILHGMGVDDAEIRTEEFAGY